MYLIHLPHTSPFWRVQSIIKALFTECFGSASNPSNPKHLFLSEIISESDSDTYKKHSLECHPSMSLQPGYKTRAQTNTCQNTGYVSLGIYKKHSPWHKQGRSPKWFLSLFCVSLLSELAFNAGFPPFSIRQLWQREFYLPLPVLTPESRCWVVTMSANPVMQFETSRDNFFLEKCIQSRCKPTEPKAWVHNRTGDRKKAWQLGWRMLTPALLLTCSMTLSYFSPCSPLSFWSPWPFQLESQHFPQVPHLTNAITIPSTF